MSLHYGIIQDGAVYTSKALARIVLEKEEVSTDKGGGVKVKPVNTETIVAHLMTMRCKAKPIGRTLYVSGLHFREAIESSASLDWMADYS